MNAPRIQYARTEDGADIAFTAFGSGPPLVILPATTASHLQVEMRMPTRKAIFERLAEHATVVLFDRRGQGMSRGSDMNFSLEARLADLHAVLRRGGFDRVAVFARWQSGDLGVAFAAQKPERVSHLILTPAVPQFNLAHDRGFIFGPNAGGAGLAPTRQPSPALDALIDENWPVFTEVFARLIQGWNSPDASDMAEMFRASHTPESWRATSLSNHPTRFDEFAPQVQAPTLILYSLSSEAAGARARAIAAEMANAVVIGYPEWESAAFPSPLGITALLEFIKTEAPVKVPDLEQASSGPHLDVEAGRGTVTILFTDVVDSTPITERMGDAAFRAESRKLDDALRVAIREAGGSVVEGKLLGDGIMATFASAGRAIQAALACRAAASNTQLSLHIGLHAGDVIDEGNNVYGWAVNMASRVCAVSAPGEVLVSETVRALARGSAGVGFEDRGLHELKGIEEPQRLFAVRRQDSAG